MIRSALETLKCAEYTLYKIVTDCDIPERLYVLQFIETICPLLMKGDNPEDWSVKP